MSDTRLPLHEEGRNPAKNLVYELDDVRGKLADLATMIEPYDAEVAERIRDAKMQLAAVQDHVEVTFDV